MTGLAVALLATILTAASADAVEVVSRPASDEVKINLANSSVFIAEGVHTWSRDGTRGVIVTQATNLPVTNAAIPPTSPFLDPGSFQTYLYNHANGTFLLASRSIDNGPSNGASGDASISADGRWLAFNNAGDNLTASDHSPSQIYLYGETSDAVTALTYTEDGNTIPLLGSQPLVSEEGIYVTFIAIDNSTNGSLVSGYPFQLNISTGELLPVLPSSTAMTNQSGPIRGELTASADGSVVAFSSAAQLLEEDQKPQIDQIYYR